MSDFPNHETRLERMQRSERADLLNSGARGTDGLTDLERRLLDELRAQGLEIRRSWLVNERSGQMYRHDRAVEYT